MKEVGISWAILIATTPLGVAQAQGDLQRAMSQVVAGSRGTFSVLVEDASPRRSSRPGLKQVVEAAPGALGGRRVTLGSPGEVLFAHRAQRPQLPASTMKLVTAAAALERLGPRFAFSTQAFLRGTVGGGILQGDLVVVGGGDPSLGAASLTDLARTIRRAGVRRISGDLVLDDRAFDARRFHRDWDPKDAQRWYAAEVSALSLNQNCVEIGVAGGATQARILLRPQSDYVRTRSIARLVDRIKRHRFSLRRSGRTVWVAGRVWRHAKPFFSRVPVVDPSRFFAAVLKEQLARQGVTLAGKARRARTTLERSARAVWSRKAGLEQVLPVMLRRSHNLYAECLIKTLGRLRPSVRLANGGSWSRGSDVLRRFVVSTATPAGEVTVRDGSGLSRSNRLSARALVSVLRTAGRSPWGAQLDAALPTPGVGTLRRRCRGLPQGITLRAKTGTLRGVSTLAGSLTTARGRRVLFAILRSGTGAAWRARREIDRLVVILARRLNQTRSEGITTQGSNQ